MKTLSVSVQQVLDTVRTYFRTRPVARVWLFGSAARGESKPGDIDLLLELDQGVSLFDFTCFNLELEAALHKRVDLISSNGVSPHIKPFIDQDKQKNCCCAMECPSRICQTARVPRKALLCRSALEVHL